MEPLAFLLGIGELIMKYGIPAVIKAIKAWQIEDPTADDFEALKDIVKDPDSYFQPNP